MPAGASTLIKTPGLFEIQATLGGDVVNKIGDRRRLLVSVIGDLQKLDLFDHLPGDTILRVDKLVSKHLHHGRLDCLCWIVKSDLRNFLGDNFILHFTSSIVLIQRRPEPSSKGRSLLLIVVSTQIPQRSELLAAHIQPGQLKHCLLSVRFRELDPAG